MQESPVLGCTWNCVKPQHWLRAEPEVQQGSPAFGAWAHICSNSSPGPSTCGTCPTDVPSAICLPESWGLGFWLSDTKSDLEPFVCTIRYFYFCFFFFYLQLYLRHVSCLWLLTKFSVFWFCVLTFLLLSAPADTALSATFSGGGFSSQVTDKIWRVWGQELLPVGTHWKRVAQSVHLCFTSGGFWFPCHIEWGLLTSSHSSFVCIAPRQLPHATRGIKLVILF